MKAASSMQATQQFSAEVLKIDAAAAAAKIEESLREIVFRRLKRKGAVVGLSGGIDSSVVAALCARALGKDRVFGLFMPETDSSDDSLRLGQMLAASLGIATAVENITGILQGARCYERRDAAIRSVVPEYGPGWKSKIVLPNLLDASYAIFSVVVQSPEGAVQRVRLTPDAYLSIVAATNFKQRTRKMLEYHYADKYVFAVAGTPNRLEYDQGFFVKGGDGLADFKPIAHLYKTQVYQMAAYLNVPEEIQRRPPTTDTYSLAQSQEEFYFALPYEQMDLCLYAYNAQLPPEIPAATIGITVEQMRRVYHMIESKRGVARYLHSGPQLVEEISEE
jgi:NAD+ synthase